MQGALFQHKSRERRRGRHLLPELQEGASREGCGKGESKTKEKEGLLARGHVAFCGQGDCHEPGGVGG